MGVILKKIFYRRGAEAQRKDLLGYKLLLFFTYTMFVLSASAPLRFSLFYA
jgi:hypothetical protein